jgi:hypothetical protein
MGEHAEEAEGLQPAVDAGREARRKSEEDRREADGRRTAARSALRQHLDRMSREAAWHLAEEIKEATTGNPNVTARVLEMFERLGIRFPDGYKP